MGLTVVWSIFLIFISLWISCSLVYWTLWTGISPMPTSQKVKSHLMKILPAHLPQGKIYELGSGWGTLAIPLAKKYPHHEVVGYELSLFPYLLSKAISKILRINNLTFKRKNFLLEPLDEAQLVVCYLYPKAMNELNLKLTKKLKPRAWVISHTFAVSQWRPYKVYTVPDLYKTKIYIYKIEQ